MSLKIISYLEEPPVPIAFRWIHDKIVELAKEIEEKCPPGCDQKFFGLQKLLEARDCFLRSKMGPGI